MFYTAVGAGLHRSTTAVATVTMSGWCWYNTTGGYMQTCGNMPQVLQMLEKDVYMSSQTF